MPDEMYAGAALNRAATTAAGTGPSVIDALDRLSASLNETEGWLDNICRWSGTRVPGDPDEKHGPAPVPEGFFNETEDRIDNIHNRVRRVNEVMQAICSRL